VNTSGIASPTLSHIHRAGAGVNGPVIINFATAAAQIPLGRTSGSSTIAAQQASAFAASDLVALQTASTANGFYVNVHSTTFPGGEIRGQLVPANEYGVAVAGRVTNGQGQTFVTDARVFNPSYTAATTALVEYLTGGATATSSLPLNIPARGTAVLDDVVGPSGLNGVGTIGALRVSGASPLAVTSRIFADLRTLGKGTFGQFVPGPARSSALRRGVLPQLSNRADLSSGYRTNVGFFNPNPSPATVRIELRDALGGLLGQSTITVAALSQQQASIQNYFSGVDLTNSANLTLSFDANVPVFGYGAVNDNVSADSIFVPAQGDSGVAAN
jgi:hypothetical protein